MAIDRSPQFLESDRLFVEQDGENKLRVLLDLFRFDESGKKQRLGVSYHATTGAWKSVPGAKVISGYLRAPISVETYQAILAWPRGQVIWQGEALRQKFERLVHQQGLLIRNAKLQTAWRDGLSEEDREEQFLDLDYTETALPLKEHQRLAAFLCGQVEENSGYGLWMQQGTGKTPTMVSNICHLAKRFHKKIAATGEAARAFRTLVVVPPSLKLNWKPELDKFSPLKGYHYILEGTPSQRFINLLKALKEGQVGKYEYLAIIVAYDTMVSSKEVIKKIPWDMIVADESHWFKDPKTARAKALLELRDFATYRYPLTGTPFGNTEADLFTQLEFIQEGASMFTSFKDFKSASTDLTDLTSLSKSDSQIKRIVAQRAFVCTKKEVLKDLPEQMFETNLVGMCDEQARHYKELATELVAKLEQELDMADGNVASVNHVLTQLLRLAQITSGFLVIDEVVDPITLQTIRPRQEIFYKQNKRLDHLVELAKELPKDEKMIIWNHWTPMIDKIFERFTAEGLGDELIVYRGQAKYPHPQYKNEQLDAAVNKDTGAFNCNRNRRFLLANPASANIGLTLIGYPPDKGDIYDTNCTEMLYYSYDWSYLKRAQANDRFHRIGTRLPVRIRTLMVEGTIDVEINAAVDRKQEMAEDIMALRDVLRKISNL